MIHGKSQEDSPAPSQRELALAQLDTSTARLSGPQLAHAQPSSMFLLLCFPAFAQMETALFVVSAPRSAGMLTDSLQCERSGTSQTRAQVRFWKKHTGGSGSGNSNYTFLKTTPGLLIVTALMLGQITAWLPQIQIHLMRGCSRPKKRVWISQRLMNGDRLLRGAAEQEFRSPQSPPQGPSFQELHCLQLELLFLTCNHDITQKSSFGSPTGWIFLGTDFRR